MGTFLAFGEIMLRLSPPGRELLLQTPKLDVWVAGAEANVAEVRQTRMITGDSKYFRANIAFHEFLTNG